MDVIDIINENTKIVVLEGGASAYMGILVNKEDVDDEVIKKIATEDSLILKFPIKLMVTFQGGIGTSVPLNNLAETHTQRRKYLVLSKIGFAIGTPTENLREEYRKLVASQYFGIDIKQKQVITPDEATNKS